MIRGTCGDNLIWTLDDNGTLTISGKGDMENFYNQVAPWYSKRNSIWKVIIKEGITSIGPGAFCACKSLTSVTIPESVHVIGYGAFECCESLAGVILPSRLTTVGGGVFLGCSSLKQIYCPVGFRLKGKLTAGNNAQLKPYIFKPTSQTLSCSSISSGGLGYGLEVIKVAPAVDKLRWKVEGKTLTVGGVSEIKAYSYEATPWRDSLNNIQRIIIEEGVEKISARAFEECRRLELLTIPASVKTIGDMAFSICYCGNGLANGGRNVYWTLEGGVLNLKKNPTVRGDADFSTGAVTWLAVEKNITGIKLEAGVVPKEKFFEWLGRRSNAMQIAFG
ncbi:MAG: leucine-rich repeat domain-containing protein [Selenomonadaceae bacterium]|nr:leucine-rich repeat domain-containing protein [Selenomonadaceae bacterium]